ncbi:MAG: aromatic amino acid lyase, partial [Bacteroidia bacterium]
MPTLKINHNPIGFKEIGQVLSGTYSIELTEEVKSTIDHCRQYLDHRMANQSEPVYGINTGFGSLYNRSISNDDLEA